ncbi:MAG TPA: class I SAM-dependent methyltransferase [Ramlibacter sp.]|uniref:class I SAM-dependent methyltransferase n=1 Tax=Ramlibacter sp. TaxID=1917967 RepID=UPI002ED22478
MNTPHPLLSRRAATRALLCAPALLSLPSLGQSDPAQATPRLDVPYVPTPQSVVDRMLQMAKVKRSDVVYDLGCGDGRIVVTAARKYGARGVGIDIDPRRIAEAKENAEKAGVGNRAQFLVADLFESDFSKATVVTLYLLPVINQKLRPQLWRQLKVGTRVVSHDFDMGDEWPPERTERVDGKTVHSWTIRPEHKKRARAG